ncbi:hypothetical protein BC940DRAFT_301114 [Gongronella butleri]|nr:hypothetical protein BC940DRAFT_301114 [Gongronella butleri]
MQRSVFIGHIFDAAARTDGVQVHFVFTRIKAASWPPALREEDIDNLDAVGHSCVGIDGGRRTIATMAYEAPINEAGDATGPSAICRVSLQEWQVVAGEPSRARVYQGRLRAAGRVDIDVREHRTAIQEQFGEYVDLRLANETIDSAFFADDHAAARFEARKGKQRVVDHSCNVILTGGRKYSARGRRDTKRNRKQRHFRTMRKRALCVAVAQDANASTQAHHDHLDTVIQGLDAYVQLLQTMDPNPTVANILQQARWPKRAGAPAID